jgi:hypothetical protein
MSSKKPMPLREVTSHPFAGGIPNNEAVTKPNLTQSNQVPRVPHRSPYREPNNNLGHIGASHPLPMNPSPIAPPDHKFRVGESKMAQPQSATSNIPGVGIMGTVPVYGWNADGLPNKAARIPDDASGLKRGK